jgi:GNAT superfamily N-acetyltransferase
LSNENYIAAECFVIINFAAVMIIRKGTREDIPSVLALIKELAEYEKAPEEVKVTEQILFEDGFGNDPQFSFFIAEDNDALVGLALYFPRYSTWKGRCYHLEDIVVREEHRGKGIGKLLFDAVVKVCIETKAKRLYWQVLDWNEPGINFYKKLNARFDNEWLSCKLTDEDLKNYVFSN